MKTFFKIFVLSNLLVYGCTPQNRLERLSGKFNNLKEIILIGDDLKYRKYLPLSGTWVTDLKDVVGKAVFFYDSAQTVYTITPLAIVQYQVRDLPNEKPIIRVSSIYGCTNESQVDLLFSAINFSLTNKIEKNSEVILTDVSSLYLTDNDFKTKQNKNSLDSLKKHLPKKYIKGKLITPISAFLIRGVNLMTISYKLFSKLDNKTNIGGAIAKINNNVLVSDNSWVLDYKLGLTYDDYTSNLLYPNVNKSIDAYSGGIVCLNDSVFNRSITIENGKAVQKFINITSDLPKEVITEYLKNDKILSNAHKNDRFQKKIED